MDNLLFDFVRPKVMDIKIGTRTFLESECANMKPRHDLFKKVMKNNLSSFLTPEECEAQAITKHRYLCVRDATSTTSELGCRIEGIAGYRRQMRDAITAELVSIHTHEDMCQAFQSFVEIVATDDGQSLDGPLPAVLASQLHQRLLQLCTALESSAFVKQHEFIGTSVLIVADALGHVGAFWIDFAKSYPYCGEISHRRPWSLGNHEDGLLVGLGNLTRAWGEVTETLSSHRTRGSFSEAEQHQSIVRLCSLRGPILEADSEVTGEGTPSDLYLLSSLCSLSGRVSADEVDEFVEEAACQDNKSRLCGLSSHDAETMSAADGGYTFLD